MSAVSRAGRAPSLKTGDLIPDEVIFGQSEAMAAVRKKVERVSRANVPVLILGESGTGKEVVARLIHRRSAWQSGPFVKVSCPAIPGTLLESELFGYEKGAFTGAYGSKPGWVEQAHGGTLFLDEIADLDLSLQSKLLQLLQDGQYSRIGGQEDRRVEVRLICTTSRLLEQEIETGNFRRDLYYRINVVTIDLPPLRERCSDIPSLAVYFLQTYQDTYKHQARPLSAGLLRLLLYYDWPGNIRQLENLIRRYVILGSEEAITSELLHSTQTRSVLGGDGSTSLKTLTRQAVRELERKMILETLHAKNWNRKEAARALNISYRALLYKIKEAGVPGKRARPVPQPVDRESDWLPQPPQSNE